MRLSRLHEPYLYELFGIGTAFKLDYDINFLEGIHLFHFTILLVGNMIHSEIVKIDFFNFHILDEGMNYFKKAFCCIKQDIDNYLNKLWC